MLGALVQRGGHRSLDIGVVGIVVQVGHGHHAHEGHLDAVFLEHDAGAKPGNAHGDAVDIPVVQGLLGHDQVISGGSHDRRGADVEAARVHQHDRVIVIGPLERGSSGKTEPLAADSAAGTAGNDDGHTVAVRQGGHAQHADQSHEHGQRQDHT